MITEPKPAPIRVPATPKYDAATADVTAARAPAMTWVKLRSSRALMDGFGWVSSSRSGECGAVISPYEVEIPVFFDPSLFIHRSGAPAVFQDVSERTTGTVPRPFPAGTFCRPVAEKTSVRVKAQKAAW